MLDFDIYSDKDRAAAVHQELAALKKPPTQSQLETMANYILFGKDENGQNAVDRKEVQIQTKYNSYKKKNTESLEALIESPTFNEADVQPIHRSIYKNPKPTLDKTLPELQPLLRVIESYESQLEDLSNLPQTKEVKDRIYNLKHLLISLRRDQYAVQDIVKEPLQLVHHNNYASEPFSDTMTDNIGPLGLKIGHTTRFDNPKEDHSLASSEDLYNPNERGINFEDPTHIYFLLESYESLIKKGWRNPYINAKYVAETLDWYISQVPFDPSRLDIIRLKKYHCSNNKIREYINKTYGTKYSENYISTIYTKEICRKIAAAVTLHKEKWENRFNPKLWKKCSCCGQWKLKDAREFIRRKSSEDGFTSRCKMCDREKKIERKKKKLEQLEKK